MANAARKTRKLSKPYGTGRNRKATDRTPESLAGERKLSQMSMVDLSKRTVALILSFHKMGNRRKVAPSMVEVDADKAWIGVSKKLFEAPELVAINMLDGEIRRHMDSRALPSFLKKGIYLLPNAFVEESVTYLKAKKEERNALVEKFLAVYETVTEAAVKNLRDLFDSADYPTVGQVEEMFFLEWRFISFNTPASLKEVSEAVYEEEKKKAEGKWADATESIQQLLRQGMAGLVNHLVERLAPEQGKKKKIFNKRSIEKLTEFMDVFKQRNVTDDKALGELVEKAQALVSGTTTDLLRTDEASRAAMLKGFEKIQKLMAPMIEEKAKRAISFQDED